MALDMTRITTHVLDTSLGTPAKDISVRLERREKSGHWSLLGTSRTDTDGRCTQLLPDDTILAPAIYRLAFDTGPYFTTAKVTSLYPVVEVTFEVRDGESHFHIPLLLSPNGYTTYRGT